MRAVLVLFHDDDCGEKLVGGYCPQCEFVPDMQSINGGYFCPSCNVPLGHKTLLCPSCKMTFEKPH